MDTIKALHYALHGVDTVIHLGAGTCPELPEYLAAAKPRIVLVEANPRSARMLQAQARAHENVRVVQGAVSGQTGQAALNVYNLDRWSSLRRATGLLQFYPGLRLVEEVPVKVYSIGSVLPQVDANSACEVCLVIDTPGEEHSILEALVRDDKLQRINSLTLRCPRIPMYEGAVCRRDIIKLLDAHGFEILYEADDSDLNPLLTLRLNRWKRQSAHLESRIASLGAELIGARQEVARETAKLAAERNLLEKHLQELCLQFEDLRPSCEAPNESPRCQQSRALELLNQLRTKFAQERERSARLKLENSDLQSANLELNQALEHRRREATDFRQRIDSLEWERDQLRAEVERLRRVNEEQDASLRRYDSVRSEFMHRQRLLDKEIARVEGQVTLLRDVMLTQLAASHVSAIAGEADERLFAAFERNLIGLRQERYQLPEATGGSFNPLSLDIRDEDLRIALQRAQEQAEQGAFDAEALHMLRDVLRPLSSESSNWVEVVLGHLRCSLPGARRRDALSDNRKDVLRAAALSCAALTSVRRQSVLEDTATIAKEHCLPEELCSALLRIRTAGDESQLLARSERKTRRTRATKDDTSDDGRRLLRCNGPTDVCARVLYFMYQESREDLLKEITKNSSRMNYLMDCVTTASVRAQMHLPPLVRNDPAAWLWRLELLSGFYELPTVTILEQLSRDVEWMIDGGAHIGYMSWLMRQFNAKCDLVAVEASPSLVEIAKRNLPQPAVKIVHAALANTGGVRHLYPGAGHSNSSLLRGATSSTHDAIEVPAVTIDQLLPASHVSKPGLLKLDIEGFELEALEGGCGLLECSKNCVLILEASPRLLRKKGQKVSAVHQYLGEFGFEGRQILESFSLSRKGYIDTTRTGNYLFARSECWQQLEDRLCGAKSPCCSALGRRP